MARTDAQGPAPRLEHPAVRLAAVVAGFHREVADRLLEGTRSRLAESGVAPERLDVHWVNGAFEIPMAARALAGRGRYAAVIALGAVIRGQTAHFDFVSQACVMGLSRVALDTGVPCALGVLTCDTMEQALARSGGDVTNAGADAADAAVGMVNLIHDVNS